MTQLGGVYGCGGGADNDAPFEELGALRSRIASWARLPAHVHLVYHGAARW